MMIFYTRARTSKIKFFPRLSTLSLPTFPLEGQYRHYRGNRHYTAENRTTPHAATRTVHGSSSSRSHTYLVCANDYDSTAALYSGKLALVNQHYSGTTILLLLQLPL